jgi:tetratricopeptide (TPR) repeat protein
MLATTRLDSLKEIWNNKELDPKTRETALDKIIWEEYYLKSPNADSMLHYSLIQIKFAQKYNDAKLEGHALVLAGNSRMLAGEYTEAFEYYNTSLKIANKNADSNGIASNLLNIGAIYFYLEKHKQALLTYEKAMTISKKINKTAYIPIIQNSMAAIYDIQGHKRLALKTYLNVLKTKYLAIETELTTYINLGELHLEMNDLNEAIRFLNKGLILSRKNRSPNDEALCYQSLALAYLKLEQLTNARVYISKAMLVYSNSNNVIGKGKCYRIHAEILHAQHQNKQAKAYADTALEIAQTNNSIIDIRESSKTLSSIFEAQGKYREALAMYKVYKISEDSLKTSEVDDLIALQKAQSKFEKEQLQNAQIEKELAQEKEYAIERRNYIQYSAMGIGLLSLFMLVYFASKTHLPLWISKLAIYLPFLLLFEFIMVVTDPVIEGWTGSIPLYKLIANALIASLIFPIHHTLEKSMRKRLSLE